MEISEVEQNQIYFVEDYFSKSGMHTPLIAELVLSAKKKGIDEKKLHQILTMLSSENKLCRIEEYYIHNSIIDSSRIKLLKYLNSNPDGITVAGFRDLINGNRKICLLLLNYFDTEGITYRDNDFRRITELGKKYLEENE